MQIWNSAGQIVPLPALSTGYFIVTVPKLLKSNAVSGHVTGITLGVFMSGCDDFDV
jgi:hypothetical protein